MNKLDRQDHLTIARIAAGFIRQREFVNEVNARLSKEQAITWNTISKLENGWKKTVSRPLANALMAVLGIDETKLTKGGIRVR